MLIQKICVMGAGISGLAAAKTFIQEGYEVQVYEKQSGIGGVWEKSRRYPGVTTQTQGKIYTYPDYPLPDSYPEWPTGEQVYAYLESYANHFGVLERIQFNTEVIGLNAIDDGHKGWMVTLRTSDGNTITKNFDFVVICNGIYHIPNIPQVPGIDTFKESGGTVLHTTQVKSIAELEDKSVVVVGFGKSACDIAMLAAEHASKSHIIFRRGTWKIPKFFFGLINFKFLLFTRFTEAMTPKYKQNSIQAWLHSKGKPLVKVFWHLNEAILRYSFKLDALELAPEKPLINSIDATINLAPTNFYKYILNHKIHTHKTSITRFIKNGVELASGENLDADVVVFGTGFKQALPFLEEKYRHHCLDEEGYFHLFRNLINPNVPNLGFVGYTVGYSTSLTSDISARWLVEFFKGNISLPTKDELVAEIKTELEWRKNHGYDGYGGTCIFSSNFYYLDNLLHDMGLPARQIGSFGAVIQPLNPQAYSNVREQLQDLHCNKNISESNLIKV